MKRYLLFAGDDYYPSGGWNDFRGSFDSVEEADTYNPGAVDWWHIVDGQTGKVIKKGGSE